MAEESSEARERDARLRQERKPVRRLLRPRPAPLTALRRARRQLLRLLPCLPRQRVEVDEDLDLGAQNLRNDRRTM